MMEMEGAEEVSSFDQIITDDGLLDRILSFLGPQDVLIISFVNQRWHNVALHSPQHTDLPSCLSKLFQANDGVRSMSMSRFKAYSALCCFNLLKDPYFVMDNPRFPIDVFKNCPWATTFVTLGSSKHYSISPFNELPGTLGDVAPLHLMPPPWPLRFKNVDNIPHRVLCSTANNLMEWTQVINVREVLNDRGFNNKESALIIDASPSLLLSVFVSMRCPCNASVEVAMLDENRVPPPYNTPSLDAYSKTALHVQQYNIPSAPFDQWVRHEFVIHGYPKGVEKIVMSLRTEKKGFILLAENVTMPTLLLTTNVPGSHVNTSDLLSALSKAVASSLGKPEQYVMVSLTTDKPMCFGGTEEPCAFAELVSIGKLGLEENKKISQVLAECIGIKLSVPANRFYIKFFDVARQDFGWNGSTFAG